jgi:uncharacterized protein
MNHRLVNYVRTATRMLGLALLIHSLPITMLAQTVDGTTPLDSVKVLCAQGNAAAMMELGERLIHGRGVTADPKEGLSWLQRSADAGDRDAWYAIGVVHANGFGVPTDIPKAITFFEKGARLGNADCQTSMGMVYQAGDRIPGGVKADPAAARTWYRMAADQKHEEAILHLGQLMMFGQGGDPDQKEGARWFRVGAELGSAECQWSLGQCYLLGQGVAADSVQAYGLFSAAVAGVENPDQKKGMGERCDKLGTCLSPQQLADGQHLASVWKARRH